MKRRNDIISAIIIISMLAVGTVFLSYPAVSNYWNGIQSTKMIDRYDCIAAEIEHDNMSSLIKEAREYNREIANNQEIRCLSDSEYERYSKLLDITGTGILGYIKIPSIGVRLPIYHGTSGAVLYAGAGHVEWSSLPVSGESTHAVISAHCGLISFELFTRLDELKKGDLFVIHVGNNEYCYEVDQIAIVEPDDFSRLVIVEGKDYVSLVTCTPYGINSHRLLVRGERTEMKKPYENKISIGFNQAVLIILIILIASLSITALNNVNEKRNSEKTFERLKENPFEFSEDIVAWIEIRETHIDYPVMQNTKDGEYYLHRNVSSEYDYRGVPFLDIRCRVNDSANLIVYGHNMLDNTMFSDLEKYENESFSKKHNTVFLKVKGEKEEREYVIIAVSKINTNDNKYIYEYTGNLEGDMAEYEKYIEYIKDNALYYSIESAVTVKQIITLSTCSYHDDDGRLIVQAMRIK